MRKIFELTKLEQRVVIVIVTLLVAFALAKHFWQNRSEHTLGRSTSTPTAASPTPRAKEE